MFDQSWRIEHYGRRIAAPAAGPGPECGEDRGSLWKGPVDSLLLDEEARPRIPLQEQARGQGRNRAGSAGGACERRDDDCRDRGGGGGEHGDRALLASFVWAQDAESTWASGASARARRQGRRFVDRVLGLSHPRRDRLHPRGTWSLSLQALSYRGGGAAAAEGEGDTRKGGRRQVRDLRV